MLRTPVICFFIFFLCTVCLNLATIKDGHNWGDDFAQYIINAKNISDGRPMDQGVMLDNPTIYPPGYSYILAVPIKFFGIDLRVLKSLNVLFWFLAVYILYLILESKFGARSAAGAAFFLSVSAFFFIYKQNILSDIAFFFFVCLGLYFFENKRGLGPFLLAASAAFWIRTAGIALFVAACIYQWGIRQDRKRSAVIAAVLMLNIIILLLYSGYKPGLSIQIWQDPARFFVSVMANAATPIRSLVMFFLPGYSQLTAFYLKMFDLFVWHGAWIVYGASVFYVVRGLIRNELGFIYFFSIVYLTLVTVWNGFTSTPYEFVRFVLPILPGVLCLLLFLYKRFGMFRHIFRLFFVVVLVANIYDIWIVKDLSDDVITNSQTMEMSHWVRDNLKEDEHYMFFKPRALALLSGRTGTAPWLTQESQETLSQRIKRLGISYIIFPKTTSVIRYSELEGLEKIMLVWENSMYLIYRIN